MPEYPCCSEYKCRRKQPIEIQRGGFSGAWYAITRYKRSGENGLRIEAIEKHQLDPFLGVALDYALEHKDEVTALYEARMDEREQLLAERDAMAKVLPAEDTA